VVAQVQRLGDAPEAVGVLVDAGIVSSLCTLPTDSTSRS
jgi:hypothetical protein